MQNTQTIPVERDAAADVAPAEVKAPADRIRVEQHSFSGLLWFVGWLFTIGFLHLGFWKGALALLIWPYYLGSTLRGLLL